MYLVKNNNQDYEICYSQGKMMEEIQRALQCNNRVETIDGNQVFFYLRCGEFDFKISIEKVSQSSGLNPGFYVGNL